VWAARPSPCTTSTYAPLEKGRPLPLDSRDPGVRGPTARMGYVLPGPVRYAVEPPSWPPSESLAPESRGLGLVSGCRFEYREAKIRARAPHHPNHRPGSSTFGRQGDLTLPGDWSTSRDGPPDHLRRKNRRPARSPAGLIHLIRGLSPAAPAAGLPRSRLVHRDIKPAITSLARRGRDGEDRRLPHSRS
jgi:hypothetical protein